MKVLKTIPIQSTLHSKPILTDIYFEEDYTKKPIVIFCHGYKGFKDWGAWNLMVNEFVNSNLFFVKFNFSHNGGTYENPIDFPDLEAFGENNYIIELQDLEDVINWVLENSAFKNNIDANNITLIGHSRGGGTVLIKASENAKITKVITWNGVSDFASRFPKGKELEYWKAQKIGYILNTRTQQQMPHLYKFYENFKQNEARLTVRNAVKSLQIPQLIIYGDKDDVVQPFEAKQMHEWNAESQLICIENMDHALGCVQPWEKPKMPSFLKEVVEKSINFIKS